jgi:type IV pilus secretin PilQ/predicted competence protein
VVLLAVAAACAPVRPAKETPQAAATEASVVATNEESKPTPVAPAPEAATLAVSDVKVEPVGDGRRVTIALTRTPDGTRDFTLSKPPRLVVDLQGPLDKAASKDSTFKVEDQLVSRVRAGHYDGKLRVVVDLGRTMRPYQIHQQGPMLVADLGQTESAVALPMVTAAATTADPPPAAAAPAADPPAPAAPPPARVAAAEPPAPEPAPMAAPPPAPEPPTDHVSVSKAVRQASAKAQAQEQPVLEPPHPVYHGQRISLDFKDADIQNVLRVLADVSGLNIIATDDVKGKVTLHLVDVPWDQALDLVLNTNRLEKTQEGNVVRISTVSRLKDEREALRAAQEAERELEPLRVRYVKVNYARADDALVDKIKGVLTDRGSVTFDDRTNTIIVRDIGKGVDDASTLIRQLDVQSPQVLIEANIVEATEDFARGLGIQWGYQYNAGPATGNPTGANFPGTIGIGGSGLGSGTPPPASGAGVPTSPVPFLADFPVPSGFASGFGAGSGSALDLALGSLDGAHSLSARLTALEEQGKAKVISRPRVITMNNVPATIQSLTILRVKLPSTGTVINTGTGGAAGTATTATEKINTGITLVVTPQISSDGYVLMNIYAKSSQPDFTRAVDGIPNEISREANSNVLVQNQETVVLGGIFRQTSDETETGIPYLRNVPGLGWLFKRTLDSKHKEELMVFLTPRVVSGLNTAGLPTAGELWQDRHQGG